MSYSRNDQFEGMIGRPTGSPALIKHTESQGARSPYYQLPYGKTETGVESTGLIKVVKPSPKRGFQQIAISEEVNRLLRKASDTVTNLVMAEDPIEQTNLAFEFKHCLEDLWENRNLREDNWGDLLNILQAVLAQVEFEQLSNSQKSSIKQVVSEYLCKAEVTNTDFEETLEVLSDAGFNPWCGISGKPQE